MAEVSRPDLVLVPGWGMSLAVWREWAERLSVRWRPTLLDLPGHGGSGGDFSAAGLAQSLLEQAPADAVWLGWSLGGAACLQLAAQARPRALVLLAASPCFCSGRDWPNGIAAGQIRGMEAALPAEPARVWAEFLQLLASRGEGSRAAVRRLRQLQPGLAAKPEVLAAGLAYLRRTDLRSMLSQLEVPALWLAGSEDPLVPLDAVRWAAAQSPAARLVEIAGAGHIPFVTHPELIESELERLRGLLQASDRQ